MSDRPTSRTDAYKYHAEDGGWIAAPNNGGDIGGLPEIADELNRLARELAEMTDQRDAALMAIRLAQRTTSED